MKKLLLHLLIAFILSAVMVSSYMFTPGQVDTLDSKFRDLYFNIRGAIPQNDVVTIVDIDEKSLKEVGQWPWPRNKFATVLENLTAAGAGVIGLDIVFAEPDNGSPAKVMRDVGVKNSQFPDYDVILAKTLSETPTIAGFVFALSNDGIEPGSTPIINGIFIEKNKPEGGEFLANPYRAILNTPILQDNVYSCGYFNSIPDKDGMVRYVPMVMKHKNIIFPSLSLEMIKAANQAKKVYIEYDSNGVERVKFKDITIPTNMNGQLLVNFRGPGRTFKYVSAVDIFKNDFNKSDIEGRFILIGTSAAGLMDLRSIPFDSVYPGVEIHANAIDNILKGDFISKPFWTMGVDLIVLVSTTFLLSIVLVYTSAALSIFIMLIALAGANYGLYYMLFTKGLAFNILFPNISIVFSFIILMAINYLLESKQKELVKKKFAAKVSPAVMEDLLKSGGDDVFAAHEREITVSFSDVRNFTNISEALRNPQTLIQLMNAYMDPMTEIIIKMGGTVDKFIGDAIMSYWNAPADVPNHPDMAVAATLMQIHHCRILNAQIKADPRFVNMVKMAEGMGVEPIEIGMGLNTGVAIVGEMGSSNRSDYTVIGDPINLGARLESLCKYYNSKCNISNFVKDRLPDGKYIYRFLDLVTVKGKKEPVEVWQIHDFADGLDGYFLFKATKERLFDELERYHHAIEQYKGSRFAEALDIFKELNAREDKSNKYIYNIYIERCEHYIAEPPVDFNGVFVHTTKG